MKSKRYAGLTFLPGFALPKQINISVIAVLVLTIVLYIPVFKNCLTNWDDGLYITHNPYLKSLSFDNLKNVFTTFYAGNYHPLTLISLAVDYRLGGIQPWPYQLSSLILHLCNIFLVYVFIKSLLQLYRIDKQKHTVIPLITAVLFGIHPFQVESVAWISERKNVLYAFFFFASLITYVRYISNKSAKTYMLSIALFILSLLSKGMAVPLSVCIILIDYFAGRDIFSGKIIVEKVPYLVFSLIFGFIAIWAQHSGEAIGGENDFLWFERIAIASYGFTQYVVKLCFPYHLSAYYPYPVQSGTSLPYLYYACIALIGLFLFIVWYYFRHNKVALFGTLFFITNISIVVQLLPVGSAVMADRYAYIPSVGFFFIIGYYSNVWLQKKCCFTIFCTLFFFHIWLIT